MNAEKRGGAGEGREGGKATLGGLMLPLSHLCELRSVGCGKRLVYLNVTGWDKDRWLSAVLTGLAVSIGVCLFLVKQVAAIRRGDGHGSFGSKWASPTTQTLFTLNRRSDIRVSYELRSRCCRKDAQVFVWQRRRLLSSPPPESMEPVYSLRQQMEATDWILCDSHKESALTWPGWWRCLEKKYNSTCTMSSDKKRQSRRLLADKRVEQKA